MNKEIIKKYGETNNFGRLLGMNYELHESGDIHYHVKINKEHLATKTAAHGGLLAAMMDGVVGVAALERVSNKGKVVSTVEMKLNFLHPAFLNDDLIGVGKVLKEGKRIIVVEGKIYNQDNVLLAVSIATMNAYPFEKSDMNS
jgi:uncharacterized protein (TIGR00369 family)